MISFYPSGAFIVRSGVLLLTCRSSGAGWAHVAHGGPGSGVGHTRDHPRYAHGGPGYYAAHARLPRLKPWVYGYVKGFAAVNAASRSVGGLCLSRRDTAPQALVQPTTPCVSGYQTIQAMDTVMVVL